MYQPATTDVTASGLKRARNAMRLKLWADDSFAHCWLCHPGEPCADGCDTPAIGERLALYQSELE